MTAAADDSAVEEAFEAYLAGRRDSFQADGLVGFADAVRASATAPGRPSAALADLLVTGHLIDLSRPSTAAALPDGRSAGRRVPLRSRRRTRRMLASAVFTKIASAGLAAKAATVVGVAVVGLGTAGFAGVLPAPIQHTFATVVDGATPFTAPQPATGPTDTPPPAATATPSPQHPAPGHPTDPATATATATAVPTGRTAAHPTDVGHAASSTAHGSAGVDGQTVSSLAHQRNSTRTATGAPVPTAAKRSGNTPTTGATSHRASDAANAHTGRLPQKPLNRSNSSRRPVSH